MVLNLFMRTKLEICSSIHEMNVDKPAYNFCVKYAYTV